MELQIGRTYILTEDEKSDITGTVFIKKGSRVIVTTLGSSRALVKDLSAKVVQDGIWSVKADKLVTPEEYEDMLMAGEIDVETEPPELEVGGIYVMKRPEVSGDGRITYLKKGARVRVESFGTISVLVQDLSDDMIDDGVWMTQANALMPLEDALIVGDTYYMGEAEKNSRGDVTFLEKGALVRLECWGNPRCVVQDLSEAKHGDGCWYTDIMKLIPIDKPKGMYKEEEPIYDAEEEASAKNKECHMEKNKECFVKEHDADAKNKHYVSEHQPIETMQSNMTHDEMIGFLKGNIIKYACRLGKKDDVAKETTKILRYAEWLDKAAKGEKVNPRE